jgi:hypothetical protein
VWANFRALIGIFSQRVGPSLAIWATLCSFRWRWPLSARPAARQGQVQVEAPGDWPPAAAVKSFMHRPVYIPLAILCSTYTGARENDFTAGGGRTRQVIIGHDEEGNETRSNNDSVCGGARPFPSDAV